MEFAERRAVVQSRLQWSIRAALAAKLLSIVSVLFAWAMVVVSLLTDGPHLALVAVAGFATVVALPCVAISNARLRADRKG